MKALPAAVAAALLFYGGAAIAQTAGDAQCIVVSNAYAAQATDANAKKIAEAAVFFYMGRISNSMTPAQLKAMLDAQIKTLTPATAPGVMNKCAAAFQAKLSMLQSVGAPVKPAAPPAKRTQPAR